MNDYLIGSGAVLTAGPAGRIAAATLHAQTDPAIASTVRAALLDFESPSAAELTKVVIVASQWTASRVGRELIDPLLARSSGTLADVIELLGRSAGSGEVHLFTRWLPDELLTTAVRRSGVAIVSHPLEAIRQAALISGQRYARWPSTMRAA